MGGWNYDRFANLEDSSSSEPAQATPSSIFSFVWKTLFKSADAKADNAPAVMQDLSVPDSTRALIASFLVNRDRAQEMCKDMGISEEAMAGYLKQFSDATDTWDTFMSEYRGAAPGKGDILSNGNKTRPFCYKTATATNGYGKFYAGPWVPRGGNAIATIRIDQRAGSRDAIKIVVVGRAHSLWVARYNSSEFHEREGTEITVALMAGCCKQPKREEKSGRCGSCGKGFRARTVTFSGGKKTQTNEIPECDSMGDKVDDVCLGLSLYGTPGSETQVTFLKP